MWGKGDKQILLFIAMLFVFVFSLGFVYAQERTETDLILEIEREYPDAVIEGDGGLGPDNFFYFIDKFFDGFDDDLDLKEERIAEIRKMIREGKIDQAREALKSYGEVAEKLEEEIGPDERDDVRRSAAAIRNALDEIETAIPEEFEDEFVKDVLEKEERIVTSVEIASKIKELCETLSELDPVEYSRTCVSNDDSPEWHKKLDRDLTEEQEKEAREFFGIMSQCFETSGGTCRCEDISITAFANKCSEVAPLAFACEVERNEAACEKMDAIEDDEPIEDLLPDYLRDVLRSLERDLDDDRFDRYGGPRECEGINDRAECEELIFRNNAPTECVAELLDKRGRNFDRNYGIGEAERECERVMFELFAPEECIEAGITDHRECGVLVFQSNAPQECIEAGLTGDHRSDERKCQKILEGKRFDNRGHGKASDFQTFGVNCRNIENPEERLRCYDGATEGVHDFGERNRGVRDAQRQCAEQCLAEGGAWDFTDGQCSCRFDTEQRDFSSGPGSEEDFIQGDIVPSDRQCSQGQELICGTITNSDGTLREECKCVDLEAFPSETEQEKIPTEEPVQDTTEPVPDSTSNQDIGSSSDTVNTETAPVTGSVIGEDNQFSKYYLR